MNAFEELLDLSPSEKERAGTVYTPKEIAQQPGSWLRVVEILKTHRNEIDEFMKNSGLKGNIDATLVLTGAGSSEFVGNAVCNLLRNRLKREAISLPTTHLTTHAASTLIPDHRYVVVSFARSGDTPESLATFDLVKKNCKYAGQIVITANKEGALAKRAAEDHDSLCILLPEETNDRSLVMTSSFSAMALTAAGLCFLDSIDEFESVTEKLARGAKRIINEYGDMLRDIADLSFARACYIGSNTLAGTMQECQLKMLEITEGRIAVRFDSFLGLRHGPQVFINDECLIAASLSSNPKVRRYEIDLLRSLKENKQGMATLIICDRATDEISELGSHVIELYPGEESVEDDFRIMTDVVAGQILGLFKSLNLGLKPDNPSSSGIINRVVKGVVIYEP